MDTSHVVKVSIVNIMGGIFTVELCSLHMSHDLGTVTSFRLLVLG